MKQPEMDKQPETPQEPKPAQKPAQKSSRIVQPMIDELLRHPKDAPEGTQAPPRGPVHPPEPSELDQDAGGGYNPDGTFPQP